MACCGDASGWAKIGLICIVVAFGLQTAGFLTNYWMIYHTVKDLYDIRVGLFWYTDCSSGCNTAKTPSTYDSLFFTLTQAFEAVAVGSFFFISIVYAFYVLADRSRTRGTAKALITLLAISDLFPAAGFVLWFLQIDYPYFLGWSAGLTLIAAGLALFSLLCLVPDIKEYPYYRHLEVYPVKDNYYDAGITYRKSANGREVEQKRKNKEQQMISNSDSFSSGQNDQRALITPPRAPMYDQKKKQDSLSTQF